MIKKFIEKIPRMVKLHAIIIFYLLQLFFIFMYVQTEVQPFVYVRF
jgi:hypothetical protein